MTSPRVRAADIAKLAGVSRAAVTQWRKRFPDFPDPVEGADSPSPLFDLNEVERWLTENDRMPDASSGEVASSADEVTTRLRATMREASSNDEVIGAYLAAEHLARAAAAGPIQVGMAAGLDLPLRDADGTIATGFTGVHPKRILGWVREIVEIQPRLRTALEPLVQYDTRSVDRLQSLIEVLDLRFGLDWRTREPDFVFTKSVAGRHFLAPPEYTKFLIDLAGIERGVLLDPCAGWAGTLVEAGRRHPELRLIGVEANYVCMAIAQQRAILFDLDLDLRIGNSISSEDPATGVVADAVISTPPLEYRAVTLAADRNDPRWAFGRPGRGTADRWLQQAIEHLADDGRAVVSTARITADGQQTAELRHELLRRGAIEAVISVETTASSTGIWVWVLARPGRTVDPDRVLMLHAPASRTQPDSSCFDEAVGTYRQWREAGDITPSDRAAVVPVRELLEPGVGLVPQLWIARSSAPSPNAIIEAIGEADGHRRVIAAAAAPHAMAPLIPVGSPARATKLSALAGVEILRGSVRRSTWGSVSSEPVRVLSSQALTALEAGASFEEAARLSRQLENFTSVRTKSGDIFIQLSRSQEFTDTITVIDVDDWAVPTEAHIVRTDESLVDRWFILACIRAALRQPWIRQALTSRAGFRQIEIPVLPLEEQRRIGNALRKFDEDQKALARQMQATRQLRDAVEDAVATGAITAMPVPESLTRPVMKPRPASRTRKQSAPARKPRARRPDSDASN